MEILLMCIYAVLIPSGMVLTTNFSNYALYRVTTFNSPERAGLFRFRVKEEMVNFLNGVTNDAALPMHIIVNTKFKRQFEKKLYTYDIQYETVAARYLLRNDDDEEYSDMDILRKFNNYNAIELWIDKIIEIYPMLEKRILTETYEKRKLIMLNVSVDNRKPAVVIVGGEEARDWLSSAVILNFLNNLIENKKLEKLLEFYEFYIIPVFNPDGYEYSMKEDRLWMKNRKTFFPEKMCVDKGIAVGVNIDRNWFFGKTNEQELECDSIYIGHKSLTEEEPKALHYFLDGIALRTMAFITVRGFAKLITIPYAYTVRPSNNHDLLMEILSSVCKKLYQKHNATYLHGNTAKYLYNFSGNSADWVKDKLNIPIVYTVHVDSEKTFLPSPKDIAPLTDEFITIINDTLITAHGIYGPLFNNEIKPNLHFTSAIMCLMVYGMFILIKWNIT